MRKRFQNLKVSYKTEINQKTFLNISNRLTVKFQED